MKCNRINLLGTMNFLTKSHGNSRKENFSLDQWWTDGKTDIAKHIATLLTRQKNVNNIWQNYKIAVKTFKQILLI